MKCVEMNWPAILVGASAVGKTSLVRLLAKLTGNPLVEFLMTSSADSTELLGCFEQVDSTRHVKQLLNRLETLTNSVLAYFLKQNHASEGSESIHICQELLQIWNAIKTRAAHALQPGEFKQTSEGSLNTSSSHEGKDEGEGLLGKELLALMSSLLTTVKQISSRHPGVVKSNRNPILDVASLAKTVAFLQELLNNHDKLIGTYV